MSYLTQLQIAYEMFKQWAAKVFGGDMYFPSPLCPQPSSTYTR